MLTLLSNSQMTEEAGRAVNVLRRTQALKAICVLLDDRVPPGEVWIETPNDRVRIINVSTEV